MLEQALIVAGGYGKRMRNLTANKPKCLIEIDGHPILKYQLDCLTNFEKVIISVNQHSGKVIEQYVQSAYPRLNCVFSYAEPKGVAYGIYSAINAIDTKKSILITVADVICFDGYQSLVDSLQNLDFALGVTANRPIYDKTYSQVFIDCQGHLQVSPRLLSPPTSFLVGVYALNHAELFWQYLAQSIQMVKLGIMPHSLAIKRGIIGCNNEFRLSHIFSYLSQQDYKCDLINIGDCCEINHPQDIAIAALKAKSNSAKQS